MEVAFTLQYRDEVVRQDIPRLSPDVKRRIKSEIEKKLTLRPEIYGKPLRSSLHGLRSLRVGDYRIIFHILLPNKVVILLIQHRSQAYGTVSGRW